MRSCFWWWLFTCLPFFAQGQTTLPTELLPIQVGGKWGYVDLKGNIVLPPRYEYVSVFREGKAIAQQNGRLGVIDGQGSVLLPFEHLNLDTLTGTHFATRNEAGKWGVIQINGAVVLPIIFDKISLVRTQSIRPEDSKFIFIIHEGKKRGAYNAVGKVISPAEYDEYEFAPGMDSLILRKSHGKIGIINLDGQEILPTEYDKVEFSGYRDNLLTIYKNNQVGFLNGAGKVVVPCEYDYFKPVYSNTNVRIGRTPILCFEVSKDGAKGIYDIDFKEIMPPAYQHIENVPDMPDFYHVMRAGKHGLFNALIKKEVIDCIYAHIFMLDKQRAIVREDKNGNTLSGVYNFEKEKTIIPVAYTFLQGFSGGGRSFFLTTQLKTYTIFNDAGAPIAKDLEVESMHFDNAGVFLMRKGTLWGLINSQTYIKPIFEGITPFKRNLAMVNIGKQYGLINTNLQPIVPIAYPNIKMRGNTAKGINAEGGTDVYSFDNQGNLIEKITYNQKIKSITVKKNPSLEEKDKSEEWDFDMTRTRPREVMADEQLTSVALRRALNIPTRSTATFKTGILTVSYDATKQKWCALRQNDTIYKPVWEYVNETIIPDFMQVVDIRVETSGENKGKKMPYWGILNTATMKWTYLPAKYSFELTYQVLQDFARGDIARTPMSFLDKNGRQVAGIKVTENNKTETKNTFFCAPFRIDTLRENFSLFNSGGYLAHKTDALITQNIHGGTWGLMKRNGTPAALPIYQSIRENKGLYFMRKNQKYGALDSTGKEIIPPQYSDISYLLDSRNVEVTNYILLSKRVERYGYLDSTRHLVIDTWYKKALPFSEGRAAVMRDTLGGKWTFIDQEGKQIHPFVFHNTRPFSEGLAAVKIGQKWGYLNTQGQIAIEPAFSQAQDFHEGKAVVREFLTGKLMYIDKSGAVLATTRFEKASDFNQNIAIAKDLDKKLFGFLNPQIQWQLQPKYADLLPFGTESFWLYKRELGAFMGLLNKNGHEITKPIYTTIEPFEAGIARVGKGKLWNMIDSTGKELLKHDCKELYHFEGNLCLARTEVGWGYLGRQGDWVIKPQFERATPFVHGFAEVMVAGARTMSYIDTLGHAVGKPADWYSLGDLNEYAPDSTTRYARITRQNMWGYWDKLRHKLFILPTYKRASAFCNGYAKVTDFRGNIRYISEQKQTLPALPNGVQWFDNERDNFKTIRKNNLYGFATLHDFVYSSPKYGYLGELNENRIPVAIYNLYGVADRQGKILLEPIYERVIDMGRGIFRVELNDRIGYWHKDHGWIWQPQK